MTLSGALWPVHLKPFEDELLSSWLVRLVRANIMSYRTFFELVLPKKTDRNKDIDRSADIETLRLFAAKTGTSIERAYQTTLRTYEGFIYERHNSQGSINWIMPIGIHGGAKMRYGLQCCPLCLLEGEPYFRRRWRLAFVTVCVSHGNMLIDRCPECGDAISFYKTPVDKDSITLCKRCGYDLRGFCPDIASDRLLNIQKRLLDAADKGWIMLAGHGPIYSQLFFKVLHQIARLLVIGKQARRFRKIVQQEVGLQQLEGIFAKSSSHIEHLRVNDRSVLTEAATWLLDDWPKRLVRICKVCRLRKTGLTRNMPCIPFWFTLAIDQVEKIPRIVSAEEVTNAIKHLMNRGKKVSLNSVNKTLNIRTDRRRRADIVAAIDNVPVGR